jgi:hypothetical protein
MADGRWQMGDGRWEVGQINTDKKLWALKGLPVVL